MRKHLPSWADGEKLASGQEAEARACMLFCRMFCDVTVERNEWDSIVDARIIHEGKTIGFIEVKSHFRAIGSLVLSHHPLGLYRLKEKQYEFAVKHRAEGKKTVFMVEFGGQWMYIDDLGAVSVREKAINSWRNKDGVMIHTPVVFIDPRHFREFPRTPNAYVSACIATPA